MRRPGQRLVIKEPNGAKALQEVFGCITGHNMRIRDVSYINLERKGVESDLAVSLDAEDLTRIAEELKGMGYQVEVR